MTLSRRFIRCAVFALCLTASASVFADTFQDFFSTQSYSRQDGNQNWSSNWAESGDDGSPNSGDIDITSNRLHLQDDNNSITRSANLSAYTTATLSFDYAEVGFNQLSDNISVEVRAGGSGTWTTLQTFSGSGVGSGSASYDISAFISSVTEIRFITSSTTSMNNNDDFYVDNVRIAATPDTGGSACTDLFSDGISSNSSSGTIQFGYGSKTTNSPDNILKTVNLSDGSGGVSCGTVACSQSGSVAGVVNYTNFPGGSNVYAGYNTTLALAPGDYGNVGTNSQVTLQLSAGDYTVNGNLSIGYDTHLEVIGAGTVRIFVNGTVSINSQSDINSPGTADQLVIYSTSNVTLTSPTMFNGFLYSNGSVYMGSGSIVTGAVTAASVTLESASTINFDSAALGSVNFGSMCTSSQIPLAQYHFDEQSWNSAAGALIDSSGNGYNATAINGPNTSITTPNAAVPGDPGTCRYGEFDGVNDYVAVPDSFPDLTGSFTITAWIYARNVNGDKRIFIDDQSNTTGFGFSLGDGGAGKLRIFSRNVNPVIVDSQNIVITANTWHFVAAVHNVVAKTRQIYVDGTAVTLNNGSTVSTYTGTWGSDSGPASIGGETNAATETASKYYFNGLIDEVEVFDSALSSSAIVALYAQTHPCSTSLVDHFDIDHSGAAIYCLPTPVSVTAEDSSNNTFSSYTGTITIDTNSAGGNWSVSVGNGVFSNGSNDDGIATYAFDASDNGVVEFFLDHSDSDTTIPLALNISVSDGVASDDDLEGLLNFSASGFTITGSALVNNPPNPIDTNLPIANQEAGDDFAVYLAAYGQTPSDPSCGVIDSYNGSHSISYSMSYNDPGAGTITPTINGNSISSPIATTFTNGQAQVTANYKDVGSIRINAADGTIVGSSNNFVVWPSYFDIQIAGNPGAINAGGGVFTAAGTDFSVSVFARELGGAITPNYGNESAPESIDLRHTLLDPVGGDPGTLTGTLSKHPIDPARWDGTFDWDEVGVITLTAEVGNVGGDRDYLGVHYVSSDLVVGRFTPHHFYLQSGSVTPGNGGGSEVTYLGQPFTVDYTVEARELGDEIALNYQGSYAAKHDLTDEGVVGDGTDIEYGALDNTTLLSYNSRLVESSVKVSEVWAAGVLLVNDLPLVINRGVSLEPPNSTVEIGLNFVDSDLITFGSLNLDTSNDTSNDSVSLGVLPGSLYYGRAFIPPVYGPEIPVGATTSIPFSIQYWNGTHFITNITDDSTVYDPWTQQSCTNGSVLCSDVSFNQAFAGATVSAGVSDRSNAMTLTRPGFGKTGNLILQIDVDPWLEYDWNAAGDEDPSTVINFGTFRGHDRIIYWREVH